MKQSRVEMLEKFYEENPYDPFNIYALALEYEQNDVKKASDLYNILLKDHIDYLPVYYKAAHFFKDRLELLRAKEIFEQGIIIAEKQNNNKAILELKEAYQNLLFEIEEG